MKRTKLVYQVVRDAYEKQSTEGLLRLEQEQAHFPSELVLAADNLPPHEVLGMQIQYAVMADALEDVLEGRGTV